MTPKEMAILLAKAVDSKKGQDILVKVLGGDLIVNYTDECILLSGNAVLVYEGSFEY